MNVDIVKIELAKVGLTIEVQDSFVYGAETSHNIFTSQIGKSNVEMIGLLCLDTTNKIINYANVAIGGVDTVKVPLDQIFRFILLSNATQFIIAHNHPSGVLKITSADIDMTKKIGSIAKLFDIKLIDSLIVNADGEFLSIREHMEEL